MAGYLGSTPVPQATQHRESFTATSGQTTFATAGYTAGFVDVYLNGSHLSPADFTATNGSDVVLASGASADDVCDIISYTAFEIADQTFTGTTTMDVAAITGVLTTTAATLFNGGFAANAASTITTADNSSGLILESTDADAQVGPTLQLKRNSGSPADADNLGNIIFVGENDADEAVLYGNIGFTAPDVSNGTEDGLFFLNVVNAGTERSRMFMNATETVFNEESLDLDFRVESDNLTHALFVQGSDGNVGIGASSLDNVGSTTTLTINRASGNGQLSLMGNGTVYGRIFADNSTGDLKMGNPTANDVMLFTTNTERFRIAANGDLTATDTSIGSNSDARLKENIADYTYDVAKFKQYEPKTFDWINSEAHNGRAGNRGFLAQAVKNIDDKWVGELPVSENSPDYNIISDNVSLTSKLGEKDAMYISVIQQLIARIEVLEG